MKRSLSRGTMLACFTLLNLLVFQFAACQQKGKKLKEVAKISNMKFTAGKDYVEYQWARLWDKQGFERPVEAFSMLLPKGWTYQGEIIWNAPGTDCAGTNSWFKAQSADQQYSLTMLPNAMWTWTTNQQLQQFNQNAPASPCKEFRQPIDAEPYLRQVLAAELGNLSIIEIIPNKQVAELLSQRNEEGRQELMSYGASQVKFYQSALTATVKWPDGQEGIILCGVSIIESIIPNVYNGTYDKQYTTGFVNRTVFRHPAGQAAAGKNQLTAILASIRTNPVWKNALDKYWKDVRRQKQVEHVGRIALMDQQTAQMGKDAIARGNQNLNRMDDNMRNWEARQSSQDKMQTNFIKTIREVENYRDETGKVELSSGYNHAWSRSDGGSFIMTDNPNFDPSSVLQDQRWKEMKKVD